MLLRAIVPRDWLRPARFSKEQFNSQLLLGTLLFACAHAASGEPTPLPPFQLHPSPKIPSLQIPDDLDIELVLQEPLIANPLYISFDERGRMWVVQYRQYPAPAGLSLLSRDNVWRNVYDAVPPPPPHAPGSKFRGKDIISIHEDTDGDGKFDKTTVFLEGLSLATAALKGRGGVFVLNPPYLLFYADKNEDDVPDSQTPEILLSGFGIEDTHSISNSLRWGPDGWIYATQGSTISASVIRYGKDGKPVPGEKPVHTLGQNVWRYHPETREYEIFAEGGGNAFGVEIDSKGRVYSGHNGGDTRGFHYVQGGYFRKGFDKHGPLSNPYAFHYFPQMKSNKVERFTHTFAIYEGNALPERYRGKLFGAAPHIHYVIHSEISPDGSSFKTQDIAKVIVPGKGERDTWFTPVDIQIGPDGALYIADWYSVQASHIGANEGKTNPDLGRIYRLQARNPLDGQGRPSYQGERTRFDLGKLSSAELISKYLNHPNRWFRQQANRILGDRKDASVLPILRPLIMENTGQLALEAFWALNLCGGFDDGFALQALSHADPHVRRWAVRLLGDRKTVSASIASRLKDLAQSEPDVETRSQLACSARRLPTSQALPIVAALLNRAEDAADIHIPGLLWWALESHAEDREALLKFYEDPAAWQKPVALQGAPMHQLLMQRFAAAGSREDLLACARLLKLSPGKNDTERLVKGFSAAFEGRMIPALPDELTEALAKTEGPYAVLLGVRRKEPEAIAREQKIVADPKGKITERLLFMRALGDVAADPAGSVPVLLGVFAREKELALRTTALASLQKFGNPEIAAAVLKEYERLPADMQPAAQVLLASRAEWAQALLDAVDSGSIKPATIQQDTLDKIKLHEQPKLLALLAKHFVGPASLPVDTRPGTGRDAGATTGRDAGATVARIAGLIRGGSGRALAGKELYYGKVTCAQCHTIFEKGGNVGPDLTPFDRANLENMLRAIVNPSAEIREGFENYTIATKDGRVLSGFKVEEDKNVFILRGLDGQNAVVPLEQIKKKRVNRQSIMPEGLLDKLSEQELRDLFAFLSSTTPPK